jgi:hypothetical protein
MPHLQHWLVLVGTVKAWSKIYQFNPVLCNGINTAWHPVDLRAPADPAMKKKLKARDGPLVASTPLISTLPSSPRYVVMLVDAIEGALATV